MSATADQSNTDVHDHLWRRARSDGPELPFGEWRCDLCDVVWRL